MPEYFGYLEHRAHGVPWTLTDAIRRTRQMMERAKRHTRQEAERDRAWTALQAEADSNGELKRLLDDALRSGMDPHRIVDVVTADPFGRVAEIRRRKAALDRQRAKDAEDSSGGA